MGRFWKLVPPTQAPPPLARVLCTQPGVRTGRAQLTPEGLMARPAEGTSSQMGPATWSPSLQGKLEICPTGDPGERAKEAITPQEKSPGVSCHPPCLPRLAPSMGCEVLENVESTVNTWRWVLGTDGGDAFLPPTLVPWGRGEAALISQIRKGALSSERRAQATQIICAFLRLRIPLPCSSGDPQGRSPF